MFYLIIQKWQIHINRERETKSYVECTGMAISSCPKNNFWNPSAPGFIIPATEGVSLPKNTISDIQNNATHHQLR